METVTYTQQTSAPAPSKTFQVPKLKELAIEITFQCNLRCKMCDLWRINKDCHSFDETVALLEEGYALGAREFQPIGCECFMREDFIDILEKAQEIGYETINMVTNGVLLNKEIIARLKNIKPLLLNVSIDGPEEIHDYLRGKGTYRKVMRNLDLLKASGIDFHISAVIMKKTLPYLNHIVDLAAVYGVGMISMQPFQTGLLFEEKDLSQMQFAPADEPHIHQQLTALLEYARENGVRIYTEPQFKDMPAFLANNIIPKPSQGCTTPGRFMYISANGDVNPCFFLLNMRPLMGNIHKQSLTDIWGSKIHTAYRKYAAEKKCKGCIASCSDVASY